MMHRLDPAAPLGFLLTYLGARVDRVRDERGASAVEWVLIAALVVGIAIAVGTVLLQVLEGEANDIGDRIQNA